MTEQQTRKERPSIKEGAVPSLPGKGSAVYFIGIGGIGMSAVARYFHAQGARVSGYDRVESILTKNLESAGIPVHYEEDPGKIPEKVDLVVYTPAIPAGNSELAFCRENSYTLMKRSDVLQLITQNSFNICVAGTHGKTTISTMIAHILRHSGYGCNAFLGGISVNYDTNFWSSEKNVCVIEADEYDRSFLKLHPDIAIITAMDADHLDIYGTEESMEQAFIDFTGKIKTGGQLLTKFGLKKGKEMIAERHTTYSLQNDSAGSFARDIRMMNGGYVFDIVMENSVLENIELHMGGMHNVENAVAAISVAASLKIGEEKVKAAAEDFKGVKRRFEYIIPPSRDKKGGKGIIYIDDYAHHPEELKALIHGAKSLFSSRRCTIVFQPHLYTRTRDLADEFAGALDLADEIVLLPIYPAREEPIPGITSDIILEKMKNPHRKIMDKDQLLQWVRNVYPATISQEFGDVFITAGAGDIDGLIDPLKNYLMLNRDVSGSEQ